MVKLRDRLVVICSCLMFLNTCVVESYGNCKHTKKKSTCQNLPKMNNPMTFPVLPVKEDVQKAVDNRRITFPSNLPKLKNQGRGLKQAMSGEIKPKCTSNGACYRSGSCSVLSKEGGEIVLNVEDGVCCVWSVSTGNVSNFTLKLGNDDTDDVVETSCSISRTGLMTQCFCDTDAIQPEDTMLTSGSRKLLSMNVEQVEFRILNDKICLSPLMQCKMSFSDKQGWGEELLLDDGCCSKPSKSSGWLTVTVHYNNNQDMRSISISTDNFKVTHVREEGEYTPTDALAMFIVHHWYTCMIVTVLVCVGMYQIKNLFKMLKAIVECVKSCCKKSEKSPEHQEGHKWIFNLWQMPDAPRLFTRRHYGRAPPQCHTEEHSDVGEDEEMCPFKHSPTHSSSGKEMPPSPSRKKKPSGQNAATAASALGSLHLMDQIPKVSGATIATMKQSSYPVEFVALSVGCVLMSSKRNRSSGAWLMLLVILQMMVKGVLGSGVCNHPMPPAYKSRGASNSTTYSITTNGKFSPLVPGETRCLLIEDGLQAAKHYMQIETTHQIQFCDDVSVGYVESLVKDAIRHNLKSGSAWCINKEYSHLRLMSWDPFKLNRVLYSCKDKTHPWSLPWVCQANPALEVVDYTGEMGALIMYNGRNIRDKAVKTMVKDLEKNRDNDCVVLELDVIPSFYQAGTKPPHYSGLLRTCSVWKYGTSNEISVRDVEGTVLNSTNVKIFSGQQKTIELNGHTLSLNMPSHENTVEGNSMRFLSGWLQSYVEGGGLAHEEGNFIIPPMSKNHPLITDQIYSLWLNSDSTEKLSGEIDLVSAMMFNPDLEPTYIEPFSEMVSAEKYEDKMCKYFTCPLEDTPGGTLCRTCESPPVVEYIYEGSADVVLTDVQPRVVEVSEVHGTCCDGHRHSMVTISAKSDSTEGYVNAVLGNGWTLSPSKIFLSVIVQNYTFNFSSTRPSVDTKVCLQGHKKEDCSKVNAELTMGLSFIQSLTKMGAFMGNVNHDGNGTSKSSGTHVLGFPWTKCYNGIRNGLYKISDGLGALWTMIAGFVTTLALVVYFCVIGAAFYLLCAYIIVPLSKLIWHVGVKMHARHKERKMNLQGYSAVANAEPKAPAELVPATQGKKASEKAATAIMELAERQNKGKLHSTDVFKGPDLLVRNRHGK